MRPSRRVMTCLFVLVVAAGCASTKVSEREVLVKGRIPRPDRILVYDFAASPADVPADSAIAGQLEEPGTPQTAEQIEAGRRVGAEIAAELVEQIHAMGLPAQRAALRTQPQINDVLIRGYLLSIEEGSAAKRVSIGFGSGKSELKTAVEGYQMTAQGLRKLGSGTVDSGGSKTPGGAVPLGVAIATGNPVGLIVSGGMKVYGEVSGSSKVEGRARATGKEIADQLRKRFEQEGWIE
ncbi:MAG: DUF4410 domain-containing protein [bacterium]